MTEKNRPTYAVDDVLVWQPRRRTPVRVEDLARANEKRVTIVKVYSDGYTLDVRDEHGRVYPLNDPLGAEWVHDTQTTPQSGQAIAASERIQAAAIWVDDNRPYVHQPTKTGVIVCGPRHSACIEQASLLLIGDDEKRAGKVQGFLTNKGRFVDRVEAYTIALAAGQLEGRHVHRPGQLCSEDLY